MDNVSEVLNNASEILKQIMEEYSLNQRQLSRIVDCDYTTISKYLSGARKPDVKTFEHIIGKFGYELKGALVEEVDDMLKVSDFGFKNIGKMGFVRPPECEECNKDFKLVIKDDKKVEVEVAQMLYDFESYHVGALIIRNKNNSMIIYPDFLNEDEEFNLNCLSFDNMIEEESIGLFAEYVNDLDLNIILILKESRNEENVYEYIYR